MAKYFRKVQIVDAIRWFPGVPIQDVHFSKDGQSAYTVDSEGGFVAILIGDWVVRDGDLVVQVFSDFEFHDLYEPVFPGINDD